VRYVDEFKKANEEAQQKFNERMTQLKKQEGSDAVMQRIEEMVAREDAQKKRDVRVKTLEDERNRSIKAIERELDQEIAKVQNKYKWMAVTFPLIPPLLLGLFVYFHRRAQEHEGVSKDRLV
jgi:ABC-2 type transport system permease protein